MKHTIVKFGLLAGLMLALLELSKYSLSTGDYYQEFIVVLSALGFVLLGFVLRNQLSKDAKLKDVSINSEEKLQLLNISKREYEVLINIAEGYSNTQIAERLFISESTIKTHVSNLLSKLNASRRTEAVKHAKEYGLL